MSPGRGQLPGGAGNSVWCHHQALGAEPWGVPGSRPEETSCEGPDSCRPAILTAVEFLSRKGEPLKQGGTRMRGLSQGRGRPGILHHAEVLLAPPWEPELELLSGPPTSSLSCPLTSGLGHGPTEAQLWCRELQGASPSWRLFGTQMACLEFMP